MEASFKNRLQVDLRQAMKSGDTVRRSVIRLLMAAITNAEKARQTELSDEDMLGLIAKEVRQRKESITAFRQGKREDLASQEEAEMAVLLGYLPEQLSHEEIVNAVRRIIQDVGATGPRDKGKVMPVVMKELKGKADGREVNQVVSELLAV